MRVLILFALAVAAIVGNKKRGHNSGIGAKNDTVSIRYSLTTYPFPQYLAQYKGRNGEITTRSKGAIKDGVEINYRTGNQLRCKKGYGHKNGFCVKKN